MYRSGSETLQKTIEAIVKSDKHDLLQQFIENEDVDIADDGFIRYNGDKLSIFKYTIEKKSLRCALAFMKMGLKTDKDEHDELMKAALESDKIELLQELLEKTSDNDKIESCLRYASEKGNAEACQIILNRSISRYFGDDNWI